MTTKRCTRNGFNASAPDSYETTKRYACTCSNPLTSPGPLDWITLATRRYPQRGFSAGACFRNIPLFTKRCTGSRFTANLPATVAHKNLFIPNGNQKHASMHLPAHQTLCTHGLGHLWVTRVQTVRHQKLHTHCFLRTPGAICLAPYARSHIPGAICPEPYGLSHMPRDICPEPYEPYARNHMPDISP